MSWVPCKFFLSLIFTNARGHSSVLNAMQMSGRQTAKLHIENENILELIAAAAIVIQRYVLAISKFLSFKKWHLYSDGHAIFQLLTKSLSIFSPCKSILRTGTPLCWQFGTYIVQQSTLQWPKQSGYEPFWLWRDHHVKNGPPFSALMFSLGRTHSIMWSVCQQLPKALVCESKIV